MLLFFCLSCLRSLAVGGEHGIGDDNTKPAIVDLFKNCLEKKKKLFELSLLLSSLLRLFKLLFFLNSYFKCIHLLG